VNGRGVGYAERAARVESLRMCKGAMLLVRECDCVGLYRVIAGGGAKCHRKKHEADQAPLLSNSSSFLSGGTVCSYEDDLAFNVAATSNEAAEPLRS
jgi:hypothetical protein